MEYAATVSYWDQVFAGTKTKPPDVPLPHAELEEGLVWLAANKGGLPGPGHLFPCGGIRESCSCGDRVRRPLQLPGGPSGSTRRSSLEFFPSRYPL
jgi:hypothetical protein